MEKGSIKSGSKTKLSKMLLGVVTVFGASLLLVGCGHAKHQSKHTQTLNTLKTERVSYNKAKSVYKNKVYRLSLFDNQAWNETLDSDKGDDSVYPTHYTLGYYDNKGNLVYKDLSSDKDKWSEVIDANLKVPYVEIFTTNKDDDKVTYYVVHRQPYAQYNQAPLSGKVTAKGDE